MCIYIRFIVLIFKETTRTTSGMGKKKIKKSLRAKRVRNCHTWTELADDLIISIMSRLTTLEILTSAQVVCKVWFNICKNPLMWRTIDMRGDDLYSLGKKYNLKKMCRHAEQLCSSRLRSLRLVQILCGTGKSGFEVSMKSGTLDNALAIAGTMHGLQHLQVFANELTDEGLREILDCCPRLVSLGLRYCFNLKVDGDLRMRCAEGIRTLWLPEDSIADYEFAEAAQDDVICSELDLSGTSSV
ncbi:putative F-box/LRR-repeat protein 21 [Pyrus x bretschneideri]|uniref:putative F-box/LRR-repeat protein 21 n=1 Tax=Pyrus x bretschneideri TaxID=225117 RepID=UPI0020301976|nr:putative F-box/LRR-repeat protein 21 [Pyrus x bretschneideri]